jgi:hypothetical protein
MSLDLTRALIKPDRVGNSHGYVSREKPETPQ